MAVIEYVDHTNDVTEQFEEVKEVATVHGLVVFCAVVCRPGEMRKAKPPTGLEVDCAAFDAQAKARKALRLTLVGVAALLRIC